MFQFSKEDADMLAGFLFAIIAERTEVLYKYVAYLDDELKKIEQLFEIDERERQIIIKKKQDVYFELHNRYLSENC